MTFGLPGLGISMYLVYMVPRDSPAKAVKFLALVAVTCALAVVYTEMIVSLPGEGPAIRFAGGAVIIFVGIFMMQAATIGAPWFLLGLVSDVLIRSWDHPYTAERNLESNLWIWLAFFTGDWVWRSRGVGLWTTRFFENAARRTFRFAPNRGACDVKLATGQGRSGNAKKLDALSLKGASAQYELLNDAQSRYLDPTGVGLRLLGTIQLGLFLVDQVASFQARNSHVLTEEDRAALPILIEHCHSLVNAIRSGRKPVMENLPEEPLSSATQLAGIRETLLKMNAALNGQETNFAKLAAPPKPGFLKPDAWTNSTYVVNALKVTIAACVCYFILAATDWDGISTIVTTCLVTALSTVGETTEKQVLRITGDSLGGLCAVAAIAWIFPQFSTIAGLTAVVAVVAFVGAWAFLSSPRLSYAGRQFSCCFFLATMTSASTPTSLPQARDRVAGVLLGVTVMWLIYDQISPSWTVHTLRGSLAKIMEAVADVANLQSSQEAVGARLQRLAGLRSSFAKNLNALRRKIEVHGYELIATERHKKATIGKLNHTCNLLQRRFIAELVAFAGQVAGTTPADDEIKALPSRSKDELRTLIARVEGKTKDAEARDQSEEISPHSYAAVLADLRITINDLLATSGAHSALLHKN
jgi:multidrug resistance protein MdtO